MGAEQSSNRSEQQSRSQMSRAEVRRLLEAQRQQYERRCQELVETATIAAMSSPQNDPPSIERNRAPYNYTRDDLQNIRESTSIYPDLNQASSNVHTFSFANNNQRNETQAHDFVFVKNRQNERFRHPCSAPSAPPAPRERSQSRPRSRNAEGSELDCPTCGSPFGVNIFQCSQGHSSCSDCKVTGRRCQTCKQAITNMRNYVLEEYVSQRKVPCPNKNDGCMLVIKIMDMDKHIEECPFKEQKCPLFAVFGNCHWRGKLKQISNHFNNMHPTQYQSDVDTEMRIMNVCNNSREVHLITMGVYNFVFHLKVSETDRNIYMTAQLIGTKMSAAKWTYEIHVYNKSEPRRKYTFADNCSSSSESVDVVFQEGNCSVLPFAFATTFINNGVLTYKIFIKNTNEGRPNSFAKNQRGRDNSVGPEEDFVRSKKAITPRQRSVPRKNNKC